MGAPHLLVCCGVGCIVAVLQLVELLLVCLAHHSARAWKEQVLRVVELVVRAAVLSARTKLEVVL